MPEIDRTADINISRSGAETVIVRIPLTQRPTDLWLERFQKMAAASQLPGRVEALLKHDGNYVQVMLPALRSGADVMEVMDAVAGLISEVNTAEQEQSSVTSETEAAIRDWWARGQQ